MAMSPTLKRYLDERELHYELVEHELTQTSSDAAAAAHVDGDALAKAVLVESAERYMLAVIPAAHHLELGSLHRRLGTQCGLATQAEVETIFADCVDGAAPAAGQAFGLPVILDDALLEAGEIYFEAGDHRHLVRMNGGEFRRLMDGVPHERLSVHAARHASYGS